MGDVTGVSQEESTLQLPTKFAGAISALHGLSESLRMRPTNHYRLDGKDPSIVGSACYLERTSDQLARIQE
jgi:hypothetical protein